MSSTIRGSNNFDSAWGNGQTWQNVTSSRALGTTYTNSTGAPIQVMPTIYLNTSSSYAIYINGVQVADWSTGSGSNGDRGGGGFIIPNGATYQFASTGGTASLQSWLELR